MGGIEATSLEVRDRGRGGRLVRAVTPDLRRLAAVVTAGAVGGFLVGGVGSRLAMMLIAVLNRDMSGRLTDDGAIMGRFDVGETAGLVLFTTVLGVLGGLLYLTVRDLRFGPPWFRVASIVGGPAVVVGAMLVHRDGVDFTLLEPAALSIALFVAIPGLFAALVSTLADSWLEPGSWFDRAPAWAVLVLVLPLVAFWPLAVITVVVWGLRRAIIGWEPTREVWAHPARAWTARGALTAVFFLALHDLAAETISLV